jgi:hypothetical protein
MCEIKRLILSRVSVIVDLIKRNIMVQGMGVQMLDAKSVLTRSEYTDVGCEKCTDKVRGGIV